MIPARHRLLLAACLLAPLLAGCPASTPRAHEGPDASVALAARTAIDAADTLRLETLRWAGGALVRGEITAAQQAAVLAAAEALESAQTVANAELAVYLASGSLTASRALDVALAEVLAGKVRLLAAKGGRP